MKAINKPSRKVMDILTADVKEIGDHKKVNNSSSFMPVVVECIGSCNLGRLFAIAHYGKQNGDPMRDPELIFIKNGIDYYPTEIYMDFVGHHGLGVIIEDEKVTKISPELQRELAYFANLWMKNIKEQQGL